jgi:serine/threonine protein kinase
MGDVAPDIHTSSLSGFQYGIPLKFPLTHWRKALPFVPLLQKEGQFQYHASYNVHDIRKGIRILFHEVVHEGAFGILQSAFRVSEYDKSVTEILVKHPKHIHSNFLLEACIQQYIYESFLRCGLAQHIPRVYDIWAVPSKDTKIPKQISFSMEKKETTHATLAHWMLAHPTVESAFAYVLAQISILLISLNALCGVDHRDLKADNILVQDIPSHFRQGEKEVHFPFTIVFLDFGFCCVGNLDGSKGLFPPLDPCPKEGRDMFHFIVSIWNIPALRERLSPIWKEWVEARIEHLTRHTERAGNTIDWVYLLTMRETFRAPALSPERILEDLHAEEWLV